MAPRLLHLNSRLGLRAEDHDPGDPGTRLGKVNRPRQPRAFVHAGHDDSVSHGDACPPCLRGSLL